MRLRKKSLGHNSKPEMPVQAQFQSHALADSAQAGHSNFSTENQADLPQVQRQFEQAQSFGHNFGQLEVQPTPGGVIQPKPMMERSLKNSERGGDRLVSPQRTTDTTTPLIQPQGQILQRQSQDNQTQHTQFQQPFIQQPEPPNGQTPNLNQSASNAPANYVFTHASNNWFKVVDQYKQGILHHASSPKEQAKVAPHGMQKILDYRSEITQKLLKEVVEPTRKHEEHKRREWWETNNLSIMSPAQINHANRIRSMRTDPQGKPLPLLSTSIDTFVGKIQPVIGNAPGSENPTSDIDVNLNGDGTEFAVKWLNQEFRKRYGHGKDSGMVYDVNFYAKDFVPGEVLFGKEGLKSSGKLDKDNSDNNRYGNWRSYEVKDVALQKQDIKDQTIASLVMMRVNMEHDLSIWEDYKNNISPEMKPVLEEAERRYQERRAAIEEGLNSHLSTLKPLKELSNDDPKALMMAAENQAYEKVLKEEVEPKRIKFEILKHIQAPNDQIDLAYIELKQAKTKALMFANEAYYTEGSVVSTVTNRQQLGRMYKAKKELDQTNRDAKQGYKKLGLTVDEHFHSLNEQIGFAFHALQGVSNQEDKFMRDIPKVGKYIHRAYSEMKNICKLLNQISPPFAEQERRAASDWEGVKQGKSYVQGKGYVGELASNAMEQVLINFGITETTPSQQIIEIKQKLIQHKKKIDEAYVKHQKSNQISWKTS